MNTATNPKNHSKPDLFDPTTPQAERDAAFAADPTLSALYYLTNTFGDLGCITVKKDTPQESQLPTPFLVSDLDVQEAFAYGYACAIHKSHTLHVALYLHGQELLRCVESDVSDALGRKESSQILETAGLIDPIVRFLFNTEGLSCMQSSLLKEAFLAGYQTAFICIGKYDRCLTMTEHMLHSEVLSSMILYREKEENSRRASARVIFNRYAVKKDEFKTDGVASTDGDDIPITTSTNAQDA